MNPREERQDAPRFLVGERPSPPDETLLADFYAGIDDALVPLYERYFARLAALAYVRLPPNWAGRRETAEDLAAETFVQVMLTRCRSQGRWDPLRGSVSAWFRAILSNRLVSRLRCRKGRELLYGGGVVLHAGASVHCEETLPCLSPDPAELAASRDLAGHVRAAIAELPPTQRQVAELSFLEGLVLHEIGDACGVSVSTVFRRLRAAQRTLRRLLSRDHPSLSA